MDNPIGVTEGHMENLSFNVVLLREENRWVAQCLEYDIAAQSDSIPGVKHAFQRAFVTQVKVNLAHNKSALQDVPAAPAYYRQLFEQGEPLANPPEITMPE